MGASRISSTVAATVLLLLSASRRQKYNFTAGDTLVFDYVVALHNVWRVTKAGFRTRETADQTIRLWDSGRDLVNLTAPGDYYFIYNIAGHCPGGMKLAVAVAPPFLTTTLPSQPPPPAPPSAQPRPPSPPTLLPAVPPPPPSLPILPAQPPLVTFTPSLPTLPTTPSTSGVSSTRRWLEVMVWIPCLTVIGLLILLT